MLGSPRADAIVVASLPGLDDRVAAWRAAGLRVVLTMGSFDLLHEGHMLYLEKARGLGDRLLVGVDDDEKVRARKGPHRPWFSERQRLGRVAHVAHVDAAILKHHEWQRWELVRRVEPDVLVCTAATYGAEELDALREHCGGVTVFPRHPVEAPRISLLD